MAKKNGKVAAPKKGAVKKPTRKNVPNTAKSLGYEPKLLESQLAMREVVQQFATLMTALEVAMHASRYEGDELAASAISNWRVAKALIALRESELTKSSESKAVPASVLEKFLLDAVSDAAGKIEFEGDVPEKRSILYGQLSDAHGSLKYYLDQLKDFMSSKQSK
jgi:hypothetical protein